MAVPGAGHVRDDVASLALHREEIWSAAEHQVALVAAPGSIETIVGVVKAAFAVGVPVAPRGASMSYTSSHLPVTADTLPLDMLRVNRVVHFDADDMTVTVSPRCTWATLNAALAPLGLRTPFWDPKSGLALTIGGVLSQPNAMLGGALRDLELKRRRADDGAGRRIASQDRRALRGRRSSLLSSLCARISPASPAAKAPRSGWAEIVLRLIRVPANEDYASFSFHRRRDVAR